MYPYIRLAKELLIHRDAPPLAIGEVHRSELICWPHDIDMWMELNNGRTLTMMDLGRVIMFRRMGLVDVMRRKRWAGTIAGASIRYRRRIRMFERIEMQSAVIGWDDRFTYAEQSLWRGEECCSHALLRMAVTDKDGIVTSDRFAEALGISPESPPLPEWVSAWIDAEGHRPWPPQRHR